MLRGQLRKWHVGDSAWENQRMINSGTECQPELPGLVRGMSGTMAVTFREAGLRVGRTNHVI